MQKNPKIFKFKYIKAPDFKTVTATGAFGGFTMSGYLNLNFYFDVTELPKELTHEIMNGQVAKQPISKPIATEPSAVREVPFGVNLDVRTARNLIEWMEKHIKEFEERQKNVKIIEKEEIDGNA